MDNDLATKIDTFVEEVNKRGRLTLREAAKILKVSFEQVEEWAKLLNEHSSDTGMELIYPTVGEPEIVTTLTKKKHEAKTKITKLREENEELAKILETSIEKVETIKAEPLPAKEDLEQLAGRLNEKIKMLDSLEMGFKDLKESVVNVEKELKQTEVEEETIIKKAEAAKTGLIRAKADIENMVAGLSDKVSKAEMITTHLANLKKAKENLPRDIASMEQELGIIERELDQLEKRASSVNIRRVQRKVRKIIGG